MTTSGLILGHARDSAIVHIQAVARESGIPVAYLDLGAYLADGSVVDVTSPCPIVAAAGRKWRLGEFAAIYQRAYLGRNSTPEDRSRLIALETALYACSANLINRPFSGWQNMSKPLQMLMLAKWFKVPKSRSTSIPEEFTRFREETGGLIYKSNSGERSIVGRVSDEQHSRATLLVHCPVLFQEQIVGDDVRVHVYRDEAFAVRIRSTAIDYRYYKSSGGSAKFEPESALPAEIRDACVAFAGESGVTLAGFDFKVDADGNWYCLEMNPSPAFESYDHILDGVIARRLLRDFGATTVSRAKEQPAAEWSQSW